MPSAVGTLAIVNNQVVFTEGTGLVTPQTFDYTIRSAIGTMDTATATLNLSAVPVVVTAVDDYFSLDNAASVDVDVMANDVLGTEPTDIISIVQTGITSGTFAISGDSLNLEFVPNGVIPTSDETMTYTIQDDSPATSQGTVTIHITSASANNRYLVSIYNSSFGEITVSGTYSDTNTPFSFDVSGRELVSVNRCVIESTMTVDASINYIYDDLITC